jgi:hypothetical protein
MEEQHGEVAVVVRDQPSGAVVSDREAATGDFWEPIRRRLISFGRLSLPLRALVAVEVALVLAGAVALGAQRIRQPMIAVSVDQQQAVQLPVSIFALTVIAFPLAWALLIAGSMRGFWLVRVVVLALFTFTMTRALAADQYLAIQIAVLAALWLYALGVSLFSWRMGRTLPLGNRKQLPAGLLTAVTFGLALIVQAVVYASNWLWLQHSAQLFWSWVGISLTDQLTALYFWILVPVAFVTGTDFAEWGEVLSGRIAALGSRANSPRWLAAIACVLAAALLAVALRWIYPIGPDLVTTALNLVPPIALVLFIGLVFAAVYWLAQIRRWQMRAAPSLGVMITGLALFVIMLVASLTIAPSRRTATPSPSVSAPAGYTYYNHQASAPYFSIAYPTGWNVKVVQDLGSTRPTLLIVGSSASGLDFSIVALPAADLDAQNITSYEAILQTVFTKVETPAELPVFVPTAATGAWHSWRFEYALTPHDPAPLDGEVWLQRHDDQVWALYGLTRSGAFAASVPTFMTMLASWQFVPPAPPGDTAPGPDYTTTNKILGLGTFALSLLVGIPLLLLGRKRGGALPALGLFVVLVGIQQLCLYLPDILTLLHVPRTWVPQFAPWDIGLSACLAIITYTAWSLVRGTLRSGSAAATIVRLLTLAGAMFVVTAIYLYYSGSSGLGPQQAPLLSGLLVLAFLWDLLTSGEQVTNRESAAFPRTARLLIYLGYTLLVTCCALYFSVLSFRSGAADTTYAYAFNPDYWAQTGLLMLGSPLLLTGFLLSAPAAAPARSTAGSAAQVSAS